MYIYICIGVCMCNVMGLWLRVQGLGFRALGGIREYTPYMTYSFMLW